ncbi:efflux transporter outer membrane subunit [Celerinatantimonas sp. YJH-8]|uniref:efflux transporter outer membrane subunit n=1 Tax=Celerinatantimonas sp. YJH-8 TaxID=3228714 RepID=UPI0038C8E099
MAANQLKRISLFIMAALLSACSALGPDYQVPKAPLAPQYKEAKGWVQATPQDQQHKGPWWNVYQDPDLATLLAQVEINNQNVAQYTAQYRQARALAAEAGANLYPSLSASGSGSRSRSSGRVGNNWSANASVSWEVDLWGKLRRTREQQQANAQASAADLASATLSAQSELAQDYFRLRIMDERIRLYQTNIAIYQRYLKVVENQYRGGKEPRASVAQAQSQLHSVQASMLDLTWQRAQLEHAIAVLIGKPPAVFSLPAKEFHYQLPVIPAGVPSQLLQRRPDIAYAERSVAAANAAIGVAMSGYFPDLTLSASGGTENSVFRNLFSLPSRVWSVGPELSGTVFDFGRTRAQVEEARAAYDAQVANYRQQVLSALEEVENYLVEMSVLTHELNAQRLATDAAQQSAHLTYNQFQAGMIDYLDVATTEATSLSSQQNLLQLVQTQLVTSVQLIVALGGGWNKHQLPGQKPVSFAKD